MSGLNHLCRCLVTVSAALMLMMGEDICAKSLTLSADAPPGFEDLDAPTKQVVDVIFEGDEVGVFTVISSPENITFEEVEKLLQELPIDLRTDEVREALSQPLSRNQSKVCPRNAVAKDCGVLYPEAVGIIHDADRFQVSIFVNPVLRAAKPDIEYLPKPALHLDFASQLSFLASGGNLDNDDSYSIDLDNLVSLGTARFSADLSVSDSAGLFVREAAAEIDLQDSRAYAGLFWSKAQNGSGRRRILGLGYGTQLDTRLDRDQITGTPVLVYLQSRGRVEIFLDERLLLAEAVPPGSTLLDTSAFPQGSYEITVRISESGRPSRTEKVFFSKNASIPPLGIPVYYAEMGFAQSAYGSLDIGGQKPLIARAGGAVRIAQNWASGIAAEVEGTELNGRISLDFFDENVAAKAGLELNSGGGKEASLRLFSTGFGSLSYNFDLRYVDQGSESGENLFGGRARNFTQATGAMSWRSNRLRLGVQGNLRDQDGDIEHSLTASAIWDFVRQSDAMLSFVGEVTNSTFGDSVFVGLNLRLLRGNIAIVNSVGHRDFGRSREPSGIYSTHSLDVTKDFARNSSASISTNLETGPGIENISTSLELAASSFVANADFLKLNFGNDLQTQYSIGAATTLLLSDERMDATRRGAAEASVVLQLTGARPLDEFEVLVDGQLRMLLRGNGREVLSLPSYRAYRIRLRPKSSDPLRIHQPERELVLYPGNVRELDWSISQMTAIIARLVDEDGEPLAGASVRSSGEAALTDDRGYFQIETTPRAAFEILTRNGEELASDGIEFDDAAAFTRIGDLVARSKEPS